MNLPDVAMGSVVFVGIDDFAFRRGFRFGTILVNLESHRVVDLLASSPSGNSGAVDVAPPRHCRGQP